MLFDKIQYINENNDDLKEVFPRLSIIEKKFVIKLLKINGFSKFDTIFQKLNISFYGLIKYLCHNKIPFMLFKNENVNIIGEYQVLLFCFKMFDIDANVKIIENNKERCEYLAEALADATEGARTMIQTRQGDVDRILDDISETTVSLKGLSAELKRNPSLLIRERTPSRLEETE